MRALIIFALAILVIPFQSSAQERKEDWPSGSAMAVGLELAERRDYSLKMLDKKHKELLSLMTESADERLLESLQQQQVAWLKYYPAECGLVGALSSGASTWQSTTSTRCAANLADLRFRRVSAAIRCVKKIPVADRLYEQSRCLYQLTPLAIK